MPIATATHPPCADTTTTAAEPTPGISTTEAQIITTSARGFLHQFGTSVPAETMAAITAQVAILRDPNTPMAVDTYTCYKRTPTRQQRSPSTAAVLGRILCWESGLVQLGCHDM